MINFYSMYWLPGSRHWLYESESRMFKFSEEAVDVIVEMVVRFVSRGGVVDVKGVKLGGNVIEAAV